MNSALPVLFLSFLLVSCGSILQPVEDTTVHHLLDPAIPARKITGTRPAVAIASPALPGYLDRSQLVSRAGTGELQMNTFHLWGESLDSGISRVTALNLGRLRNSLNIQPVRNFVTVDYQTLLELRISRFEPDSSNRVVLDATWKLQPVEGPIAPTRSFTTIVPILGPPLSPADPQTGRIAAMNEALARLAREIARAL